MANATYTPTPTPTRGGDNKTKLRVRVVVEAVCKDGSYHRMHERSLDFGLMRDPKAQDSVKHTFIALESVLEAKYDFVHESDRKKQPAAQPDKLDPQAMHAWRTWLNDEVMFNCKHLADSFEAMLGLRWCEAIGKEALAELDAEANAEEADNG